MLTLYSHTLLTMNLPKVRVGEGSAAPLVLHFSGGGNLQPASVVELSSQAGWKVKEIRVKEGDRVSKGQALVTYENREAENQLRDEQANQERQRLMMEGLQERFIEASQGGDESKLRSAKRDIEVARLEMGVQERRVRSLQEDLEKLSGIIAPFDGVITKVNAVNDLPSGSAGPDVRIANASLGFQLALQMPVSIAEKLELGDKLSVQVRIKGVNRLLEGQLAEIKNSATEPQTKMVGEGGDAGEAGNDGAPQSMPQKQAIVILQSNELQGGEQASVQIDKTIANEKGNLVPNEAIHGDGTNATKVAVEIGESNEHSTVVLKGVYPGLSVIVESSEPLQDGGRVRLY